MAGKGSKKRPCDEEKVAKNWPYKSVCPRCNREDCQKAKYRSLACSEDKK